MCFFVIFLFFFLLVVQDKGAKKEIIEYVKFKYDRTYDPYRKLNLPMMLILFLFNTVLLPGVLGLGEVVSSLCYLAVAK